MSIIVAPAEDGRYQVLVNYIRQGVPYSNKEHAEKEAEAIRVKIFGKKK